MYKDKISNLYLNSSTKPVKEIKEVDIKKANEILDSFNEIDNADHLFLVLAAINLLNAAIKKNEYKRQLSYGFIKSKAAIVLELLIVKGVMEDTSYYYDRDEKCMYVKVHGVVFSFHYITENELILDNASKEKIEWPGIRLQKIAVEVFDFAQDLSNV